MSTSRAEEEDLALFQWAVTTMGIASAALHYLSQLRHRYTFLVHCNFGRRSCELSKSGMCS